MKRMLINATQQEELRVALVDGQRLFDLDIETPSREKKKSNIYKGKVTRVEPSLEAAFIDYGADRHGFLPLKEIARSCFREGATEKNGKQSIKELLAEGQELVVQVEKEERGNKGAALTTFISLAGRYLVLMPNNPRAGGVSRRIEGDDRTDLREALSSLEIPESMGLIVRTAGVGRSAEELQWDLDYLLHLWNAIELAADAKKAPFLIFQDSNLTVRALRDYMRSDIGEVLIDDPAVYRQAHDFMQQVMPHNVRKVKFYEDEVPLFSRYQIENQIESAFNHEVILPSGGTITIDHTEALTAIDVNSARATKGSDIEETALNTNLEAADEVARQMRIRDLGGLIVIDFIDMTPARNQREVENRLNEALKMDRARIQTGRISRFGLLEMSRQRLRPSLGESSQVTCPRCNGQGTIRDVESLSLSILRVIEEESLKENTGRVQAQLPVDVATFLLNEKRDQIIAIEDRQEVSVVVIPNPNLETPHFQIERVRRADLPKDQAQASYEMIEEVESATTADTQPKTPSVRAEEPMVKHLPPERAAPPRAEPTPPPAPRQPGLLARVWSSLFGSDASEESDEEKKSPKSRDRAAPRDAGRRDGGRQARSGSRDARSGGGRNGGRGRSRRRGEGRPQDEPAQGRSQKAGGEQKAGSEAAKPEQAPPRQETGKDKAATQGSDAAQGSEAGQGSDAGQGRSGSSRRGRRGGRRRRRGEGATGNTAQGEQGTARNESGRDAEQQASGTPQEARPDISREPAGRGRREENPAAAKPPAAANTSEKPPADGAEPIPDRPASSRDRGPSASPAAPPAGESATTTPGQSSRTAGDGTPVAQKPTEPTKRQSPPAAGDGAAPAATHRTTPPASAPAASGGAGTPSAAKPTSAGAPAGATPASAPSRPAGSEDAKVDRAPVQTATPPAPRPGADGSSRPDRETPALQGELPMGTTVARPPATEKPPAPGSAASGTPSGSPRPTEPPREPVTEPAPAGQAPRTETRKEDRTEPQTRRVEATTGTDTRED
ncbi:MAG: ribonuclease E [Gammaproteobacteria bacterium]|nr:ribonuclease E [Gammaproteobacteria bacterium]